MYGSRAGILCKLLLVRANGLLRGDFRLGVGRGRRRSGLLHFAKDGGSDEDAPNDASEDAVDNEPGAMIRLIWRRILEPQAAIDHGEGDEDATQPEMCMGPERAALDLLKVGVVRKAEDGLEKGQGEGYKANDWVVRRYLKPVLVTQDRS